MKVAGAYWRGDSQATRCCSASTAPPGRRRRSSGAYLHDARGGREARPPQARQAARPVPHAGRGAGPGVLASEGLGDLAGGRAVHARASIATPATRKCAARRSSTCSLWEKSGHWDNYKENMFFTESEKRDYALKPMNCPGHVQIFNQGLHSYRDLPIRYGEFGACHRNEPSGALHGIMRVRGFTQDDGHIFCTEDQIDPRVRRVPPRRLHGGLRATSASPTSSQDRDCGPSTRARRRRDLGQGRGGAARRRCARSACEWTELPGEGAFYGPKIEYHLKDAHRPRLAVRHDAGRFHMPGRLGAEYVDEDEPQRHPGDAAPGDRRLAGALHRHPDRAPCRRTSRPGWRRCRRWS